MTQWMEGLEDRRLLASGTLDVSFGTNGSTTTRVPLDAANFEKAVAPAQIIVDAGGRTLVLARTVSSVTLYRLTEVGTLDTSFAAATGGHLRFKLPSSFGGNLNDVRMGQDQNFRTYLQLGPQVVRLTSSGKVDRTYGLRGNAQLYTTAGFTGGRDIAVQADGSAYVVGSIRVGQNARMAVAKLTPAGALDANFASKGVLVAPVTGPSRDNPGDSFGSHIRILNNGAILATGYIDVSFPADSNIKRVQGSVGLKFNARGQLDSTYGKNGRSIFTVATDGERFRNAEAIAIRGDGAILHYTYDLSLGDSSDPSTDDNYLTASNGRANAVIDMTPHSAEEVMQGEFILDTNVHPGDANAYSELFVNRTDRSMIRFSKLSATYTLDATFNGGVPIGGVQAAGTTLGGAIVYSGTGRSDDDNALTVARVFATEAPSAQASIPVITSPVSQVVVKVQLRDDDRVVYDPTDGVPSGAILYGPNGPIVGKLSGGYNALSYTFVGPGGGWDKSENGFYDIDINFDDVVHDSENNYIGLKRVGKLFVVIA